MAGGVPPARFREKQVQYMIRFWNEQQGQDLVEYSLLLAFVCLTGAAMFVSMGSVSSGIWSIVNTRLAASNQPS